MNQSWEEYLQNKANTSLSVPTKKYFTVFRVGEKFYNNFNAKFLNIEGLFGFQFHSNRQGSIENVDSTRSHLNRILIGDANVTNIVNEYIKGVKVRTNSVMARELVLSGGNGFYDRLTFKQKDIWIANNIKFLKDNFGDNCVYAVLHLDETTPHIHALIVPKMKNDKGIMTMNNGYYFGSKDKMIAWQDKYTNAISTNLENVFMRGIRGSKAKHINLKTYYALINEDLKTSNAASVLAYAKENYINRKKVQELQDTLQYQDSLVKACESIAKNNEALKKDKRVLENTIKILADKYNISEKDVINILKTEKALEKSNKKERER